MHDEAFIKNIKIEGKKKERSVGYYSFAVNPPSSTL